MLRPALIVAAFGLAVCPSARAQDPSLVPSATSSTSTATEVRRPPFGKEDVPYLEKTLSEAQDTFERALQRWSEASEVAQAPGGEARRALRAAEDEVRRLEAELQLARTAPARALVEQRLAYDRALDRIKEIHAQLLVKERPAPDPEQSTHELGPLAAAIRNDERELDRLEEARKGIMTGSNVPRYLEERLSDLEKLDEEIRAEEERLAFAERIHDHLLEAVLGGYLQYEKRVVDAVEAFRDIEAVWTAIRGTEAIQYQETAPTPYRVARDWFVDGPSENILGLIQLWTDRGAQALSSGFLNARSHAGKLARYRREADQHRFVRDRLLADAERLRILEANGSRSQATETIPPIVTPPATSEYARLSARIDQAKLRLEAMEKDRFRVEEELASVGTELDVRKAEAERARVELEQQTALLEEGVRTKDLVFPVLSGRPIRRALEINNYVRSEVLESLRSRSQSIDRAIRRIEIRRDVLRRRLSGIEAESERIRGTELRVLRRAYYLALSETFGIRSLRVILVLAIAFALIRVIRKGSGPLIERLVQGPHTEPGGVLAIRKQRARTLITVFIGATQTFVYVLAFLFVIGQLDIDYGPLLVAAGGLSLAVGFGAQSLVKDFFAGFFILLEGQYSIGDVVEIGGRAGIVEDLNLRTTILRNLQGEVHTIPNGEITTTCNKTKFWARSVVDVDVAYEEDIDNVIAVLAKVGTELKEHQHWSQKVRAVDVLGLEGFGDNAITVRVLIETQAGEQWSISREFQRRVKIAFDSLDIEIPWPQRVVTHKEAQRDPSELARKHRSIQRFLGYSVLEPTEPAGPSVEERQRAEVIAQKEAALLAQAEIAVPEETPDEPDEPSSEGAEHETNTEGDGGREPSR